MPCSTALSGVEEAEPGRGADGAAASPFAGLQGLQQGVAGKPRRFTSDMLEQLSVIDQEVNNVMAAEAERRDIAVQQHTQLLMEAQVLACCLPAVHQAGQL